ncbi:MAG: hypothetical protein LPK00_13325 [Bacillaceae bacterium]|nr:hypothetical protein [Bacillaceae bacterium]
MRNETKKEKLIRISLIVIISIVTMFLFKVQFQMFTFTSETQIEKIELQVEVLQVIDKDNEYPIIAMVKENEGKPMLVTYKINVKDNFRFETIQAVELTEIPKSIMKDEATDDLWVELKDGFTLFTKELNIVNTRTKIISKLEQNHYSHEINKMDTGQYLIEVYKEDRKIVHKAIQQKPVNVYALSKDETLWLIELEDDVMLLFS